MLLKKYIAGIIYMVGIEAVLTALFCNHTAII